MFELSYAQDPNDIHIREPKGDSNTGGNRKKTNGAGLESLNQIEPFSIPKPGLLIISRRTGSRLGDADIEADTDLEAPKVRPSVWPGEETFPKRDGKLLQLIWKYRSRIS